MALRYIKLLLLLGCLSSFTKTQGQYVSIPDAAFRTWLNANGFSACMNGNQLDTTCSAVLNATTINFTGTFNISDLTGIGYFDNVDTIYVFSNNLTSLPQFPAGLLFLDCSFNDITSLSNLPIGLRRLEVDNNPLGILPTSLPDSLRVFHCEQTSINSLPTLPDSLQTLWCHKNQLTSLPTLPAGLKELSCYQNAITVLPNLPSTLYLFDCGTNQLTNLPVLTNCTNLTFLDVDHNQLTTLPTLPFSLYSLNCDFNLLTTLPNLNILGSLNCSDNLLSALPTLSLNMQNLFCSNNQLTILPTLPDGIDILWCNNNQLTGLPELPETIVNLDISNNPAILCLPKQNQLNNFTWFNTGIICLPNVMTAGNSNPLIDTVPVCDVFNATGCPVKWNISGRVYSDQNANCIAEVAEPGFKNVKMNLFQNNNLVQQTFTSALGEYTFDTDTGSFSYSPDTTISDFDITCPVGGNYVSNITTLDSLDYDRNFAIECPASFDLGIEGVVPYGIFRPGNVIYLNTLAGDLSQLYGLNCANGISGSVKLSISGPAYYTGILPGALTPIVNGDTLEYLIADFANIDINHDFGIELTIFSNAVIGDDVCLLAEVFPLAGDINPVNNLYSFCATVVNSFDPNDKLVNPDGIIDTSQQSLNYTVRFQNTGTAPALNVFIVDTLDQTIDEASIQLISYSHEPFIQINGNIIRFNFQNINLPDSTNDEPGSHGYVQYRVNLHQPLTIGTVIQNTAYIYFDFNTPVITNTTFNQVDVLSGQEEIQPSNFQVFPNPCFDCTSLTIKNVTSGIFKLYDVQGRMLYQETIKSTEHKIALPLLSNGVYLCEIENEFTKSFSKVLVIGK